ncbi:amidohydrolase family protein [Qipengyuania nanhaisediminis]|uniref:amidohydrolase family protein n=1 Tax=Qipengyuania nanhaisediminis TaxID=604088 RepID=UPI0038B34126
MIEAAIEPDLPIIDPHHHLWDLRPMLPMFTEPGHRFIETLVPVAHYTFDQFQAEIARSGHNIRASVFMECGAFYNAAYGDALKPVGEVEYVNGVAAQSASGLYDDARLCAGIVGHADLTRGGAAGAVLDALKAAAPGRFRGIRHQGAWDADPEVLGPPFHAPEGLYRDTTFREGFAEIGSRGLSFDAWVLEPQLPDVIDLARAFPDTPICLDHCGTPLGNASYRGRLAERFDTWRDNIRELARCENVTVKLGGLAMHNCAMPENGPAAGCGSEELARLWKPYVETCIEAFGANRAMFESNYPVDRWGADYAVLWNTFKRIVSGASAQEKAALFAGTAARFYAIEDVLA